LEDTGTATTQVSVEENQHAPHGDEPKDSRPAINHAGLPPLRSDPAFWGMTCTQFFGAFNDNVFKQLMLLLAIKVMPGKDLQGLATVIFALPFILFSGFAGYLSDRFSKWPIIFLSKVAEIFIMFAGMMAFIFYGTTGFTGLLVVLFMMGTQSAFFGPGKYGILPEMLRGKDLPRANGLILMTTFFAIIFGTAIAGPLKDTFIPPERDVEQVIYRLWMGSAFCVGVAVVGTFTSLLIRRVPPANPGIKLSWAALTIPPDIARLLWHDRKLAAALGGSCVFWGISGIVIQAVNSLGEVQLKVGSSLTSMMVATTSVGIAAGAVLVGYLSQGKINFRLVRIGAYGLFIGLVLLAIPGPNNGQLLGFGGSLTALVFLGMSAGMFAIPVQVFIQVRPSEGLKGRMIAFMNVVNFIAILMSGVIYFTFDQLVEGLGWQRSAIFGFTAAAIIPLVLFFRLENEDLGD